MKFNELLEVTKDIDLEAIGVSLGKAANRSEMTVSYTHLTLPTIA